MLVNISGHHIELTPALKSYAEAKMHKLEKHFKNITNVHVVLSLENKSLHKAEAEVHSAGAVITAAAESKDMYASIEALSDKLDKQIIKHKTKIQNHHRNSDSHQKFD
jgi:putative sigma-54 modulation protein